MAKRQKGQAQVEKKARALKKLVIEYVPISDLKPNTYNPNRQSEHDFELLIRSMREDGFTQPIVCQPDLTIIDGEHRWRAAQALDLKEVPITRVDMTPEQMRIATLRHNRARGSEDIEMAADVLRDLEELGALDWAKDSLMLSDEEINRLIEDIPVSEALAADEHSQAWVPTQHWEKGEGDGHGEGEVEGKDVKLSGGGVTTLGATEEAFTKMRERERAIAAAKSEQEAEKIRKDTSFYRVQLMFANDEAEIVKRALGKKPAVTLLEMCKEKVAQEEAVA